MQRANRRHARLSWPGTATATAAAVLAGLALAGACRDAPELLEPPGLEPLGPAPYQLTFDPGREISPTWSASGDEVIYVSEQIVSVPAAVPVAGSPPGSPPDTILVVDTTRTRAIVRVIPREGGVAEQLLPVVQPHGTSVPIDFAAQASTGQVAAFTLLPLLDRTLCGGVSPCDHDVDSATPPRLASAVIRVREPGASTPPEGDRQLEVAFEGRTFDTSQNPGGLSGVWVVDKHPFQRHFNATRRVPDRLSWSPEGDRLVFSDGLSLVVWNLSSGTVTPIPGTEDGVDPAWSPTGEWIVFERAVRGSITEETCQHEFGGTCVEQRRTWTIPSRSLALVRPDGSDLRLLPEGSRPTWDANGRRIYYESGRRIWTVGLEGQDPVTVPATVDGFQPAVSPDGRWLAFARMDSLSVASDIWIAELEP